MLSRSNLCWPYQNLVTVLTSSMYQSALETPKHIRPILSSTLSCGIPVSIYKTSISDNLCHHVMEGLPLRVFVFSSNQLL